MDPVTSVRPILCRACRHLGDNGCTSFPGGIPDDIRFLGDHHESIAGEPPFELDPDRQHQYKDWLLYSPHAGERILQLLS
jgi:hypothetical protein